MVEQAAVLGDDRVEFDALGEEGRCVVVVVAAVVVGGDVVDVVPALLDDDAVPLGIGRKPVGAAAAGDRLDGRVEALHERPSGAGPFGVGRGRDVPGLPGRVHLVAQAPQLHAVGLRVAVGRAFVRDARAGRHVAVLEELRCLLGAGGPQVDRHHRFGPDLPAPGHELVGAELVRLDRPPREVGAPGPPIERSRHRRASSSSTRSSHPGTAPSACATERARRSRRAGSPAHRSAGCRDRTPPGRPPGPCVPGSRRRSVRRSRRPGARCEGRPCASCATSSRLCDAFTVGSKRYEYGPTSLASRRDG